jgi:hypothetical protein
MWTVSKWIVWLWPYALIAIGAHRSRLFDLGWPVLMAASDESEFALAEVGTSALPTRTDPATPATLVRQNRSLFTAASTALISPSPIFDFGSAFWVRLD